jgi:hypothetical protein
MALPMPGGPRCVTLNPPSVAARAFREFLLRGLPEVRFE